MRLLGTPLPELLRRTEGGPDLPPEVMNSEGRGEISVEGRLKGGRGVGEGAEPFLELAQHLTLHLSTSLHAPRTIRTKSGADLIQVGVTTTGRGAGEATVRVLAA